MYSNCWCSCLFEPEIIKIGQSSHKMYSNNILNFQESTTILNACTKKSGKLLKAPRISTRGYPFYDFIHKINLRSKLDLNMAGFVDASNWLKMYF